MAMFDNGIGKSAADIFLEELAAQGKSFNSGMTQEDLDLWNELNGVGAWDTRFGEAAPHTARFHDITRRSQESGKLISHRDAPSIGTSLDLIAGSGIPGHRNFGKDIDNIENSKNILGQAPGLAMLALPFAAAGVTAAAGAGGAGTAGALGAEELGIGFAAGGAPEAGSGLLVGETAAGAGIGGGEVAGGSGWYFDDYSGQWVDGSGSGLDMTRLEDPAYWNELGGDTGLAAPGAEGVAGSTSTYGGGSLLEQASALAKEYGITTGQALKMLAGDGKGGGGLLEVLGRAAPGIAGAIASDRQADNLKELADKFMGFGAPSRDRYEASFQPGFNMASDPGYQGALDQAAKSTLHGLSVGGNPAGSPNSWARSLEDIYQKTAYPALQQYRNQNAATGGYGAFNAAAPGAATGAISARGDMYNAIGATANDIFNPPKSFAEQWAELRRQGLA